MFRLVLCDDNKEFLEYEYDIAQKHLQTLNVDYEIQKYMSGLSILGVDLSNVDLVLLDYEMEGINGFETAKVIGEKYNNVNIAFVTVFYELSREGYKFDAIRYLVKQEKSFDDDLRECIDKAFRISELKSEQVRLIDFVEKSIPVSLESIAYIQSSGHYQVFYLIEGNSLVCYKKRAKFSDIREELKSSGMFSTIRNGTLVNLKNISSVDKKGFVNLRVSNYRQRLLRLADSYKTSFYSDYMRFLGEKI